jgi:hypothetical protein
MLSYCHHRKGQVIQMAKQYGSPQFRIRLKEDMYEWLRDYASRQGKGMSAIIKEYLESLRRKDQHTQRKAQESTP